MEHARCTAPHLIDLCARPKGENPALPKAKKTRRCSEQAMPRSSAYAKAKRSGMRPSADAMARGRSGRVGRTPELQEEAGQVRAPRARLLRAVPHPSAFRSVYAGQRIAAVDKAPDRVALQQPSGGRKWPDVSTPSTPAADRSGPV
jgi:hypothetical protein